MCHLLGVAGGKKQVTKTGIKKIKIRLNLNV